LKCAKTCKRCCELEEFNCPNKQGKLDCAIIGKGGLCKTTDPNLKREIRKQCPRTCGFCIATCRDQNAEMCSILKDKCSEPMVKEICKRTCRVCIPGSAIAWKACEWWGLPTCVESVYKLDDRFHSALPTFYICWSAKESINAVRYDCVDLVPTCLAMKDQCNEQNMKDVMHAACNETCGLCQQSEPCEDLSAKYVLIIFNWCRNTDDKSNKKISDSAN
uniref:ShKT domain-containing protein n=1 Tax=Gongylonema pulchrum TaxID=637853 RepID=A0A183DVD4_9BILA